jgi:hypothetical protein
MINAFIKYTISQSLIGGFLIHIGIHKKERIKIVQRMNLSINNITSSIKNYHIGSPTIFKQFLFQKKHIQAIVFQLNRSFEQSFQNVGLENCQEAGCF